MMSDEEKWDMKVGMMGMLRRGHYYNLFFL
jgi:hypothetical protein